MIPKAMDSLDLVEAVMLIEEVFGTEIPGNDAENFGSLELTSQTSAQIKGPLFC